MLNAIEPLEVQTDTIASAAQAIALLIGLSEMRPRWPVHRRIRPGSSAAVRLTAWTAALLIGALFAALTALCANDDPATSARFPKDRSFIAFHSDLAADPEAQQASPARAHSRPQAR